MYHDPPNLKGPFPDYTNMPRKANFIFDVQIRIAEAFTLDSIVRSPRTFKPKDVLSACQNNELVLKSGSPPQPVLSLATYVMTDFFAMAHATGLYNRQRHLWESLSQVNSIHIYQQTAGLFQKQALPVFDFSFLDYKGKPLICALLVLHLPGKEKPLSLLKSFISRWQGKGSLTGSLCCFAEKIPPKVMEYVQRQTFTNDPIAKYESIMPGLNVPLDLLEMNTSNLLQLSQENSESGELRTVFSLVHPDLKKAKEIKPPRSMRKATPKPKTEVDESTSDTTLTNT
jgi:hypothetical protein